MDWQPIETAPRDGTRILVSRRQPRIGPTLRKEVAIASFGAKRGERGHWSIEITANNYCCADDALSGWLPLPPPSAS